MTVEAAARPLDRLKALLAEVADLQHAEALITWDSRVTMPHHGAAARADVAATLTRLVHERLTSDELRRLLEDLAPLEEELGHEAPDAALVRVTRRDLERLSRVPADLAAELVHAATIGVAAWDEAKAASDFELFAPHLERQLELKHRYIDCFPDVEEPYDVLIEDYEEGMTTAQIAAVFDELKRGLVPLIERLRREPVDDTPLRGPFPIAGQKQAARDVLEAFGYSAENWRLDETPHPFASKPGLGDIRLTTAYLEDDLNSLFSTMHEFGHGVYEFGVDPALARSPLETGTSSAMHESQSRTWENLVGRSNGFWHWFYPKLQSIFPPALDGVEEAAFVQAINAVRPGLIRIDADEVTYGLHIIMRFELEQELLSGEVKIRELPEAWNERMRDYLGLDVPDDAHGVLQDMHWSTGTIGHFATYQLGNVMSVQIWRRAEAELGNLDEQFARGEFAPLREWLTEHVYRWGRIFPPRELLQRVTGSDLDPGPYLEYLHTKFA